MSRESAPEIPAVFWRRVAAFAGDVAVVYLSDRWIGPSLPFREQLPALSPYLLYFWLSTAVWGATPGKMLVGIEVRAGQGRVGWGRAFVREVLGKAAVFGAVSSGVLPTGPAYGIVVLWILWIGFHPLKRGWHDLIAGTRAVRRGLAFSAWDGEIGRRLAEHPEVRPEMLEGIPLAARAGALASFAARHPDEVVLRDGILRPTGAVEWF